MIDEGKFTDLNSKHSSSHLCTCFSMLCKGGSVVYCQLLWHALHQFSPLCKRSNGMAPSCAFIPICAEKIQHDGLRCVGVFHVKASSRN